ncbi:hypothetical protein OG792_25775 [Micromonospora sp. NBC_01699]|uniref:hypothetical protein n=1 Tax=Micromonospora sp. NBC_01699 TaxID=2975984 RepID=UPI002E35E18C|nr:hypothetical protein [Micromonospora sp. NBC_01699]
MVAVLCRPYVMGGTPFPEPPSLRAIAAALHITESAVKKHLSRLYDRFGLTATTTGAGPDWRGRPSAGAPPAPPDPE